MRKEVDEGEEKNLGRKNGRKERKEVNKEKQKKSKEGSEGVCILGAEEFIFLVEGRSLEVAKLVNF